MTTSILNDQEINSIGSDPLRRLLRVVDDKLAKGLSSVSTSAVGNVTTGEDDLISMVLSAGLLDANGKGVRITAWGIAANNSNTKTVKLYFGHVILTTALTVSQVGVWRITAEIVRVSAGNQAYVASLNQGGTATLVDVEQGVLTEDETAEITVKCTGEATSTDDIVQKGLIVGLIG